MNDTNICKYLHDDVFYRTIHRLYFDPENMHLRRKVEISNNDHRLTLWGNILNWEHIKVVPLLYAKEIVKVLKKKYFIAKNVIKETEEKYLAAMVMSAVHFALQCDGTSADFIFIYTMGVKVGPAMLDIPFIIVRIYIQIVRIKTLE